MSIAAHMNGHRAAILAGRSLHGPQVISVDPVEPSEFVRKTLAPCADAGSPKVIDLGER